MHDEEHHQIIRQSNRSIPHLIRLICCIDDTNKRIKENLARLLERYPVLRQVGRRFLRIPLKKLPLISISGVHI